MLQRKNTFPWMLLVNPLQTIELQQAAIEVMLASPDYSIVRSG